MTSRMDASVIAAAPAVSRTASAAAAATKRVSRAPLELDEPITECVLRRVPGPRWALIALWGAAVLATPFVLIAARWATGQSTELDIAGELGSQAVLAYVVVLLLWGVAGLVERAATLRPDVQRLTGGVLAPGTPRASALAGPVALASVVIPATTWSSWTTNGIVPTLVVLPLIGLAA